MNNERLKQATSDIEALLKKYPDYGCLFFLIDFKADVNVTGHQNIDIGDALVCISRIVEGFNIDPPALFNALVK